MSEQQNPATSPVAPGTPVTDVDTAMRKDAGDRSGAWADTIAAGAKTRPATTLTSRYHQYYPSHQ